MPFTRIRESRNTSMLNSEISLVANVRHELPLSNHAVETKSAYTKHIPGKKFRSHQERKWYKHFADLVEFKRTHNHCHVSYTHSSNPELARWVKRQRYQYYLFREGNPSCMTEERIKKLNDIGFVWGSHETVYQTRIQELLDFKRENGHCVVPARYPKNTKLATWVKCQRRQFKLFKEGRPSNITIERILALDKLGFKWNCQQKDPRPSETLSTDMKSLKAKSNTGQNCKKYFSEVEGRGLISRPFANPNPTATPSEIIVNAATQELLKIIPLPSTKPSTTGEPNGIFVNPANQGLLNGKLDCSTNFVNEGGNKFIDYKVECPLRTQAELNSPSHKHARDYRLFMEVLSDLSSDSEEENDK